MKSLLTVSPVITAFHSCCLLHHVFDQVNLWPAWVGFETAIFWQCSPGTAETQLLYPLRHGPRSRMDFLAYLVFHSRVRTEFLSKARGEIWPKRSERRNNTKKKKKIIIKTNYQDEDKKSAINKKLILKLRSLISKWFQLKVNYKEVSSTIFWVFGMTRLELQSPSPLANTLPIG